jgi:F-type H+-transporting ATPase subunit epsilon
MQTPGHSEVDSYAADAFNPRNISGTEPPHPVRQLRCAVVTPERAVLDEPADLVILPMFDGELGVLPNRSPFVGQLGPGELRITSGGTVRRYFVDGGFVQVRANVVNVLTPRAVLAADLTAASVEQARSQAETLPATNPAETATRKRALERARGMAKVAAKGAG